MSNIPDPDTFIRVFIEYNDAWEDLAEAYWSIPRWPVYHFIMQMRNLNQRGRLTRGYERWCRENGIFA